jgi:hypothetical protein
MPVKTVPITDILPVAYNPRTDLQPGDDRYDRIARSLDRFGLVDPLVWNERTGNLVGGHQRLKILKAKGVTSVEVSVVNLSDEDEKALNLVLNSPTVSGEWDADRLTQVLADLEASSPDLYDEMDLGLLNQLAVFDEPDVEKPDDEEVEAPPDGPPAMELLPYESYDYIVLMFRDSRDFLVAIDHFGLQKVSVPAYVGSKKIGLGRVLDGAKYMARVRKDTVGTAPAPEPETEKV